MAGCYPLHTGSLVCQILAFCISLAIGVVYLMQSDHLASAQAVADQIKDDSHLRNRTGANKVSSAREEDSVHSTYVMMRVVGITSLIASAVILFNLLGLASLMCGPTSSLIRYCVGLEPLRDALEEEIVDVMKTGDEQGFCKRLADTLAFSRRICGHHGHSRREAARDGHRATTRRSDARRVGKRARRVSSDIRRRQLKLGFRERGSDDQSLSASTSKGGRSPKEEEHEERSASKRRTSKRRTSPPQRGTRRRRRASASPERDRRAYDSKLMEGAGAGKSSMSTLSASPSKTRKEKKSACSKRGSSVSGGSADSPKYSEHRKKREIEGQSRKEVVDRHDRVRQVKISRGTPARKTSSL